MGFISGWMEGWDTMARASRKEDIKRKQGNPTPADTIYRGAPNYIGRHTAQAANTAFPAGIRTIKNALNASGIGGWKMGTDVSKVPAQLHAPDSDQQRYDRLIAMRRQEQKSGNWKGYSPEAKDFINKYHGWDDSDMSENSAKRKRKGRGATGEW